MQLPAIPEILKDPKLLQLILAKLEQETARAEAEKQAKVDAIEAREAWKQIAAKEAQRADELVKADKARIDEAAALRQSVGFLRTSVDEYKDETKDLRRDNDRLRSSRKWFALGGTAVGITACVLSRP